EGRGALVVRILVHAGADGHVAVVLAVPVVVPVLVGEDEVGRVAIVLGRGDTAVPMNHRRYGELVVMCHAHPPPAPGEDRRAGEGATVGPDLTVPAGNELSAADPLHDLVVVGTRTRSEGR